MAGQGAGEGLPYPPRAWPPGAVLGPVEPVPAHSCWPGEGAADTAGLLSPVVSGWGSPDSTWARCSGVQDAAIRPDAGDSTWPEHAPAASAFHGTPALDPRSDRPLWPIPPCRGLVSLAGTREKRRECLLTQDTKQALPPSQRHQIPVGQSPLIPACGPNPAAGRCHRLWGGVRRMSVARKSSHLLYLQLPRRLCWAPRPLARPVRPWRLYLSTSS